MGRGTADCDWPPGIGGVVGELALGGGYCWWGVEGAPTSTAGLGSPPWAPLLAGVGCPAGRHQGAGASFPRRTVLGTM